MREECAQVTNMEWWYPHLRQHIGAQELGEGQHVDFVGLDARLGNQLDLGWMSNQHASDQANQLVIHRPSVGGGLKHNCIGGEQLGLCPGKEAVELDLTWLEHDPLLAVNGANHQIALVDVDGDEAEEGLKWGASHATLLVLRR